MGLQCEAPLVLLLGGRTSRRIAEQGTLLRGGVSMSDNPCTGCRSLRNGRLFYAYVNHYVGDEKEERRLRLCQSCVFDLLAPLLEGADYKEGREWVATEARTVTTTETSTAPPAALQSPAAGPTPIRSAAKEGKSTTSAKSASIAS